MPRERQMFEPIYQTTQHHTTPQKTIANNLDMFAASKLSTPTS
jgi:hypothetical protein